MGFDAAVTLGVLLLTTVLLVREALSPDLLMLAALAALLLTGVLDLESALYGFANPTLLAIGSLYVIAAALRETGALERASRLVLGGTRPLRVVLLRLSIAVAAGSAFMNNTPIVAMGIPAVRAWASRHGVAASKLLMPLSFASILGGLCTLIGTSTNLVTDGLLRSHGLREFGFFELAWVGVPCTIAGIAYVVLVAPRLLGEREDVRDSEAKAESQLLEFVVLARSPLIGRTVADTGLQDLRGMDLVRFGRGTREVGPVSDRQTLAEGDRLVYQRAEASDRALAEPMEGLSRAKHRLKPLDPDSETHEAVVREGSALSGVRVLDAHFPERFAAAVTGVRRGGARVEQPLGEIMLRPGDTLMLQTGPGFREVYGDAPDFVVVTEAGAGEPVAEPPRVTQAIAATAVLATAVTLAALEVLHIATASLAGAVLLVAMGLLSPRDARGAVDWSVLIVIGTAFGLADALETSGAARMIGDVIVNASAGFGPVGLLAGVVAATMLLTGLISNVAAAALMFPIALSVAQLQALDPRPLMIGITVAASLSLWTPLGYQTNLMVYGPGSYRFTDFTRLGLPMQLLLAIIAVAVIPLVWPF